MTEKVTVQEILERRVFPLLRTRGVEARSVLTAAVPHRDKVDVSIYCDHEGFVILSCGIDSVDPVIEACKEHKLTTYHRSKYVVDGELVVEIQNSGAYAEWLKNVVMTTH